MIQKTQGLCMGPPKHIIQDYPWPSLPHHVSSHWGHLAPATSAYWVTLSVVGTGTPPLASAPIALSSTRHLHRPFPHLLQVWTLYEDSAGLPFNPPHLTCNLPLPQHLISNPLAFFQNTYYLPTQTHLTHYIYCLSSVSSC